MTVPVSRKTKIRKLSVGEKPLWPKKRGAEDHRGSSVTELPRKSIDFG